MQRSALSLLILLSACGFTPAQDMPLSQILIEGEGWRERPQHPTPDIHRPEGEGASLSFAFDPRNPVPTISANVASPIRSCAIKSHRANRTSILDCLSRAMPQRRPNGICRSER